MTSIALPIVLHIPHSSICIPQSERAAILLDDEQLTTEILRITDRYTDELFDLPGAQRLEFPVSRLIVDPERFSDDEQEPQAKVGLGVIYTLTTHGEKLRNVVDGDTRNRLLHRYYFPHHEQLNEIVDGTLGRFGKCLILDCHSFPSKALPYELDKESERLDICIGTDDFHTPGEMAEKVTQSFVRNGFESTLNRPYKGTLVSNRHYLQDSRVASIMIEINRSRYMNEVTGKKSCDFSDAHEVLCSVLADIADSFTTSDHGG